MELTQTDLAIIEYSIEHNFGHIPSALTQGSYLQYLIPKISTEPPRGFLKVAGKPFGAQAWYVLMRLNNTFPILTQPTVHWNCTTVGHSLGYSLGLSTDNNVWLNMSDGYLECGDFWESLSIWHKIKHKTLFVTVDCNGYGCKHPTMAVQDIQQNIQSYGITCKIIQPEQAKGIVPYDGVLLIDTSNTFGAEMKRMGFHYTKFKNMEDFYALCNKQMDARA